MAKERLDRREFTSQAVLGLLSGVAITLTGCGSNSPAAPRVPPAPVKDVEGIVAANHGHFAVVTGAQQTGGVAVTIDIRGTSGHTHQVTLSEADLLAIRGGATVVKQSNGTGHTHTVSFN